MDLVDACGCRWLGAVLLSRSTMLHQIVKWRRASLAQTSDVYSIIDVISLRRGFAAMLDGARVARRMR